MSKMMCSLAPTHADTWTWEWSNNMLFYCSEALPSNCHPPCGSSDTTTHTSTHASPGKPDCSPCTQKEKKNKKQRHKQDTSQTHSASRSAPPPPPSYHPVRSRRWFFGRSCRAHRSQASATLCPSPPSLLTPTHTDPSGRAFAPFPAHQLFSLLPGHMHARAHRPSQSHIQHSHTHTHTGKSADAKGRAVGAWAALTSGQIRRRRFGCCSMDASSFIHHWSSRLDCSVTGTVYRMC